MMAAKIDAFQSEDLDLECPVCLGPQIEPIALTCGHSCCRLCLVRATRLSVNGRACPLCRADISIKNIHEEPSDARRVEAVRQHLGSEAYDERLKENLEELAEINRTANRELPIFAMYPGTQVGGRVMLHLFEPRYKILVRRCWEGNHLFVYCGSAPRAGGTGVVVRILEALFLPDGRANIVGVGLEEITLEKVWVEDGTGGLFHTKVHSLLSSDVAAGMDTADGLELLSTPRQRHNDRCCVIM